MTAKPLYVLDVSTAIKWFLPPATEPYVERAVDLWLRQIAGDHEFIIPDLFWAEFGNVLAKAIRTGRCTEQQGLDALRIMGGVEVTEVPTRTLAARALDIAHKTHRSYYDSVYVALAVEQQAVFITADERLVNALGPRWPVQWLGSL